jgi:hypothetical protein
MFGNYDSWKTRSDRDDEAGYWEEDYRDEDERDGTTDNGADILSVRFANLDPAAEPEWFEQIVVTYYPDDCSKPLQRRRFFFPFRG